MRRKLGAIYVTVLLILATTTAPVGVAGAAVAGNDGCAGVSPPVTIHESGCYRLTSDATGLNHVAVFINASDVRLEGNGKEVGGMGDGVGVVVTGPYSGGGVENVTVQNLTVSNYGEGVYVTETNDSTFRDLRLEGYGYGYGFVMDGESGATQTTNRVARVTVTGFTTGVSVQRTANTSFEDVDVSETTLYGIVLGPNASHNTISKSSVSGAGSYQEGVAIYDTSHDRNRIVDTTVHDNDWVGVLFGFDDESPSTDTVLRNVSIRYNDWHGIWFRGARNPTIEDSVTANNNGSGIEIPQYHNVTGLRIRDHRTDDNAQPEFEINGTGHENNTVERMTIGSVQLSFTARSYDIEEGEDGQDDENDENASTAGNRSYVTDPLMLDKEAPNGYLDATIQYEDEDVSELNESSVALWINSTTDGWYRVAGSSVDTEANTVRGNVTDEGAIALLANESTSSGGGGGGGDGDDDTLLQTGGVAQPSVGVSPDSLSFGETRVGETATRTVSVTNSGNETLKVTGLSVPGSGVYTVPTPTFSLDPGESRSVTIRYEPTASGQDEATFELDSNDPDQGTVRVPLTGQGVQLGLSVTPTSLSFGTVTMHTRATRTVAFENTGDGTVTVSNLSVSGSPRFGAQQGSFSVAPGETTNRSVYFEPTTTDAVTATLAVNATHTDGTTATVDLDGSGQPAALQANRTNVSFGTVQAGASSTARVALSSREDGGATVSDLTLAGANASAFAIRDGDGEGTLTGDDERVVTVAFEPPGSGAKSARLQVRNGTGDVALEVALDGNATAPDIAVSPSSLSFANATVGETSTRSVAVSNRGDANLTVESVRATGGNGSFGVDGPSSFVLAPGANRTLNVSFAPQSTSPPSGTLLLVSDDPDRERTTVYLSSTGVEAVTTLNRTNRTTQLNATVRNATAGEEVSVSIPQDEATTNDSVQVDAVSVTPKRDGNFSLNVTSSTDPLDSTPSFNLSDGTQGLGYMSVGHSIDNANISNASFTYRVNKSRMANMQSEPEDVSLYRNVNGTWTAMPTTLVGEGDTYYAFRTTAPGLSEWTAAAKRPRISVTDAFANVTAASVDDEVSIRVRITNTGGADGVYETRLLLNGSTVESKRVTVVPNSTRQVFFERSFSQPGDYTVEVNEVFVAVVDITGANRSVDVSQATTVVSSGNATATTDPSQTTTTSSSGFGPLSPVVAVVALLLAGLSLAGRRRE